MTCACDVALNLYHSLSLQALQYAQHMHTHFKTEALRLVDNVQLVKGLLLQNEWQMQHYLAIL